MSQNGDALAETIDGITLPINCSFEKVNGWIHGSDVHFEEVQALCLGMAAENDRLRAALRLARDMFIANDMDLPHTQAVISAALGT